MMTGLIIFFAACGGICFFLRSLIPAPEPKKAESNELTLAQKKTSNGELDARILLTFYPPPGEPRDHVLHQLRSSVEAAVSTWAIERTEPVSVAMYRHLETYLASVVASPSLKSLTVIEIDHRITPEPPEMPTPKTPQEIAADGIERLNEMDSSDEFISQVEVFKRRVLDPERAQRLGDDG